MKAKAVEITDADLGHWAPGVRMFRIGKRHVVVDADTTEYPTGSVRFIRRPTVAFFCKDDAVVTDMTADHTFAPGTTAEDALAALGHTIGAS